MLIYRAHKNLPHSQNMHQLTVTVYGVVHQHPSIHLPLSQSRSRAIIQLVQDGIPPSFRFSRHLARHEVGVQLRLGDEEVELALLATCLWDEWKEEVSFMPRVHWFFSFWGVGGILLLHFVQSTSALLNRTYSTWPCKHLHHITGNVNHYPNSSINLPQNNK